MRKTEITKYDVFVSYSFKDNAIAKAVVSGLESKGLRCWFADRDVRPGRNEAAMIADAVQTSHLLVLIYTENSNESSEVVKEIDLAVSFGKTIVPLALTSEAMRDDLAYHLSGVHWLDAVSNELTPAVDRLASYVQRVLKAEVRDEKKPNSWWKSSHGIAIFAVAAVAIVMAMLLWPKPEPAPDSIAYGPGGDLMADTFTFETESNDDMLAEAANEDSLGAKVKRSEVSKVTFASSLPEGRSGGYDVSASGDGSVLAWFDEVSGGLYNLTIAANGPVRAPADCSKLLAGYSSATSVDLSGLDTSGVTDMHCMFYGCSQLKQLDITGLDTTDVTDMHMMFYHCSLVPRIDVSRFDTSNVTDMHCMFEYCNSITSLDASAFNTKNVTNMKHMFLGCSSLESLLLDAKRFDTSSVTNMESMFNKCSELSTLDVRGFDTSNVTNMYAMFYKCSKLSSLDVSGFKTSAVTDMSWAFGKCAGLKALNLTRWDVSKAEKFENMFQGATDSLEVLYPRGDAAWEELVGRDDLGGSPRFVAKEA